MTDCDKGPVQDRNQFGIQRLWSEFGTVQASLRKGLRSTG